ncbi:SRPBCC domain-containing protein [Novosphingobium nitrogenifigens]|nr:SRPBCC domain-containing protein [Novosphingobium nitrogenifigens]
MRVVFVDDLKAMRLAGALGPLQSEGVSAVLTVTFKATDSGTRVLFEYVVGGFMRYPIDKISGAVDGMLASQLVELAKTLGPVKARAPEKALPSTRGATPAGLENTAPPSAEAKAAEDQGLGRDGLLLPRGRIWSLPAGEKNAVAADAGKSVPVDDKPSQQPVPVTGGVAPARDSAPGEVAPASSGNPGLAGAKAGKAPKAAARGAKGKAAKVVKPVPVDPDEPSLDAVNSLFDATVGSTPAATSAAPSQSQ